MCTIKLVSPTQLKGWQHPLSMRVTRLAKRRASRRHLEQALSRCILNAGLWSPFLPVPFTADSPEGLRLQEALEGVRKKNPDNVLVHNFFWKFWRPKEDTDDAIVMGDATGVAPIPAQLALAEIGIN